MKNIWFKKIISCVTLAVFLLTGAAPSYAQTVLPAPGTLVALSQCFEPAAMAGVQIDLKDPFRLNFLIKRGEKALEDGAKREEYNRLIKYFLASLTIPNDEMWVNLSPYESGRVIPDDFGKTDMGRDLLAQDYILKQITASLIYPENEEGKAFWAKVYAAAYEKYGTTDVPVDTFNKVWIIPDKAVIYEKYDTAVIVESHLKVMLESDYEAMSHRKDMAESFAPAKDVVTNDTNLTKNIIRSVILPVLEKEINEGENFSLLRQIYSAMTMATWFKRTLRQSLLGRVYADKSKVNGVELNDPGAKEKIYQQYLEAYRKGVFNFIKEERDPGSDEAIPRKYFSGGIQAPSLDMAQIIHDVSEMTAGQRANFDAAEHSDRVSTRIKAFFDKATGRSKKSLMALSGMEAVRATSADAQRAEKVVTSLPGEDDVRNVAEATRYVDPVLGEFVDLDHFVFAQKKLSEAGAYDGILSTTGFNKAAIDKLIEFDLQTGQSTYEDPRLNVTFFDQSGNPRLRGITEAVSNGLDALYAGIGVNMMRGQFSKGVKQIIDWLEPNGRDRVEVYSYKDGAKKAYKLTILRASQGSYFIQIKEIGSREFQVMGRDAMGKDISHGTVLKLIVQKAIVETEAQLDRDHHDSIEGLANGIKASSAFVRHFKVMLQAGDGALEKLNGFTPIVAPEDDGIIEGDGEVVVRLRAQEITIADNGIGMDGRIISRMFAPGLGNKDPKFLNDQEQEEELKNIIIGYKKGQASRTVSFGRRGETLRTITIGDDVHPDAVVSGVGGLMVDLGLLVSVQESREDFNLTPAFTKGMVNAVERVLSLSEIAGVQAMDQEKIRIVNAMMLGLDGLRRGNVENERLVDHIFSKVQDLVTPLIGRLKEQGYVALPHYKDFEKISLSEGKKAFFVHAKLFSWNADTLKDIGAQVIPGIKAPGNIPILVLPFTTDALKGVSGLSLDWHSWGQGQRVPIISTDRFIAVPREFGEEFRTLAEKRRQGGLDSQEEKEFFARAQMVKIIISPEGITSYEMATPKQGLVVEEAPVQRKTLVDEKAKEGLAKLLAVPPVQGRVPVRHESVPADARMKWALLTNGHVVEIGTGKEPVYVFEDIVKLEPLANGYYLFTDDQGNAFVQNEEQFNGAASLSTYKVDGAASLSTHKVLDERFVLSPDKKFVCKVGVKGELLGFLDLEKRQDKIKDMLVALFGDSLNYMFSAFKISRDGKRMFVVGKNIRTGNRGGYILDLGGGGERGVFELDKNDEVVGPDPFSDLVVIKNKAGYSIFDMNHPHIKLDPVEYFRTSADGVYTVMVQRSGAMNVYDQRMGAVRSFSPGELFGISFVYGANGDVGVLTVSAKGGINWFLRSKDLMDGVAVGKNHPYLDEALLTEFISSETKDVLIRVNDNRSLFDTTLEPLSDVQDMLDPKVYKHPVFDLLIDKTDHAKIVATSLATGRQFVFDGDIFSFGRDGQGDEVLMSSTDVAYYGQEDMESIRFSMKATDGRSDGFSIIGRNAKYELISNSNFARNTLEFVPWDKYQQIDFDGKYFVFTDTDNGDVLYLDPAAPENLIEVQVNARSEFGEVPDDANMKADLDKDGNIVQIGTGKIIRVTRDFKSLRPLMNNYYEYTHQDGGAGVLVFGEDKQKNIFFEYMPLFVGGNFSISPLGHFIYQLDDDDCEIRDLRTVKKHMMKRVIHQRDFEDFMVKASKPGQKFRYSDLQFSDDEKILFLVSTDLVTGEKRGHLVDTDRWEEIPLTDSPVSSGIRVWENSKVEWSPLAKAFITRDTKTGMGYFLAPEQVPWGPIKYIRTSSSWGTYNVGVNNEGVLEVYTSHNVLKLGDAQSVTFAHSKNGFEAVIVTDKNGQKNFIRDGKLVKDPNGAADALLRDAILLEEMTPRGTELKRRSGSGWEIIFEPIEADTVTPRSYKHPDADYLIDSQDPKNPVAISLKTGERTSFFGDLVLINDRSPDPYIVSMKDGKYYQTGLGGNVPAVEISATVASFGAGVVLKNRNGYELYRPYEDVPVEKLEGIDPRKYTKVVYSGLYFVFIDPLTQEAVYRNPFISANVFVSTGAGPRTSSPSAQDQKILDNWDEKVVSRADAWMAQVREKKAALLDVVSADQIGRWLEDLDKEQDRVIRERFKAYVDKGMSEDGLDLSNLPFDIFFSKVDMLVPVLKGYLPALKGRLTQAPYEFLEAAMSSLDVAVRSILIDDKLKVEFIDEDVLDTIVAGWSFSRQSYIDATPLIAELRVALHRAEAYLPFSEERKIIEFLAYFVSFGSQDAIEIVKAQVRQLLDVRTEEGQPYVKALIKAFEKVDHRELLIYAEDPTKGDLPGQARAFAAFLTNKNAKHVPEAERYDPKGSDMLAPGSKITISQIMRLWQSMVKEKGTAPVMSPEDLARALEQGLLPPMTEEEQKAELKLINDILNQAEPGAHTREVAQNSRDAIRNVLRKGALTLRCYISGKEFVEEYQDDGSGAEYPLALVMPVSTKAAGVQEAFTGFFGAGNLTMLRDVDRVEKITRHGDDAFMFTFTVERDTAGNPQGFFITGIRKLDDPSVAQGVTIRRIKSMDHSIPQIDRMVVERGIQTFAGLAQSEDFVIKLQNEKGEFEPLTVKTEALAEVGLTSRVNGRGDPKDFGKLKVWQTEDMPSQVIDGTGLRVGEIKEEYLALVPPSLRRHIKELGIILQIPLPLTRSRNDFEHAHDHLPAIQKYTAIAFYQALAYKTLTQTSPQFNFEGYPMDMETNGSSTYWSNLVRDAKMLELASKINNGRFEEVTADELGLLTKSSEDLYRSKDFVNLLLMLQVVIDRSAPDKKESVLDRRLAIQEKIDAARTQMMRKALQSSAYVPSEANVPLMREKVDTARGIAKGHEQMNHPENFIVEPRNDAERDLLHFAWRVGSLVQVQQVVLVEGTSFAGAFRMYQGKPTMFISRSLADLPMRTDGGSRGIIDEKTYTVIHELAHLLEHYIEYGGDMEAFWKQGFVSMPDNFEKYTHQPRGLFTESMRYVAGLLAVDMSKRGFKADAAQVSPYGGIDLNERYLDLEVRRDGAGIPLSFDQQPTALMDITGLIPEIIEITPVEAALMPIFFRK